MSSFRTPPILILTVLFPLATACSRLPAQDETDSFMERCAAADQLASTLTYHCLDNPRGLTHVGRMDYCNAAIRATNAATKACEE